MDTAKNYDDNYEVVVPENDDFDLEYIDLNEEDIINVNPEEVLKAEVQREKTLKEALLNLMSKQASLLKVKTAEKARETGATIDKIIKGVEEKAQAYEKGYLEEKAILDDYNKKLDNLKSLYEEGVDFRLDNRDKFETKEQVAINQKSEAKSKMKKMQATKQYKEYTKAFNKVKDEFNQAVLEGDTETEIIKRKELIELKQKDPTIPYKREMKQADDSISLARKGISECDQQLIDWLEDKNKAIDRIENETNQALSGIVKQNFWQKLIGSLVNKFHKVGKVAKSAFGQIKKITDMMDEVYEKMNKEYEEELNANMQAASERAEAKAEARAERKAARAEKNRKHKQDIIKMIDERIAATEKQLEAIRAQRSQDNGKSITPVFEGGDNVVQFDRDD